MESYTTCEAISGAHLASETAQQVGVKKEFSKCDLPVMLLIGLNVRAEFRLACNTPSLGGLESPRGCELQVETNTSDAVRNVVKCILMDKLAERRIFDDI